MRLFYHVFMKVDSGVMEAKSPGLSKSISFEAIFLSKFFCWAQKSSESWLDDSLFLAAASFLASFSSNFGDFF